jgi:hypothetical protein
MAAARVWEVSPWLGCGAERLLVWPEGRHGLVGVLDFYYPVATKMESCRNSTGFSALVDLLAQFFY